MRYPLGLVFDSAKHVLAGTLRLDPNLAISVSLAPLGEDLNNSDPTGLSAGGNGAATRATQPILSVERCLAALDECRVPVVSICGAQPLEYPEIQTLAREILARRKHLFLCTDGTLIRRRLHMIPPYTNFFWNVKLDGTTNVHDGRAGRPGAFLEALDGVKAAKNAGFFVVVTTTIYPDTSVADLAELFPSLHAMHVDGYMLAPANASRTIDKEGRVAWQREMWQRFREATAALGRYNLLNSPVELEYLRGERELGGYAWGTPRYGPRGWSMRGCGSDDEYAESYVELVRRSAALRTSGQAAMPFAAHNKVDSKLGNAWKMLTWPFGGSLGEKREAGS